MTRQTGILMRPEASPTARFIRYETRQGAGIFGVGSDFRDILSIGLIRVPRVIRREIEALAYWLNINTTAPPGEAYADRLSRSPITWFKATATGHVARAERLCRLLNEQGVNLRRVCTDDPGRILFEDDVQIVTRRPRSTYLQEPEFYKTRHARRIQRLASRRKRSAWNKARKSKHGLSG